MCTCVSVCEYPLAGVVRGSCELPSWYCELNLDSLEVQQMLYH